MTQPSDSGAPDPSVDPAANGSDGAAGAGNPSKGFTGRSRSRTTRKSVLIADKVSRALIMVGGIGTIASVLGVALFLIYVVLPLFLPAEIDQLDELPIDRGRLVALGIDEYQILGYTVLPAGKLEVFRVDDGSKVEEHDLFAEGELVSSSFPVATDSAAFGLADGTVQLVDLSFDTEILDEEDLPAEVVTRLENADGAVRFRNGMIEPTPAGQFRFQALRVEKGAAAKLSSGPVRQVTFVDSGGGPVVVALAENRSAPPTGGEEPGAGEPEPDSPELDSPEPDTEPADAGLSDTAPADVGIIDSEPADLQLILVRWEESTNFLTGAVDFEMGEPVELPRGREEAPVYLALTSAANEVYSVWEDGYLERINIRNLAQPFISESGYLLEPGSGETISFFAPILGGTTFLWGDSGGSLSGGFTVRAEDAEGPVPGLFESKLAPEELRVFARTKALAETDAPALSLGPSQRSRLAATGFADGELRVYNITNATEIMRAELPSGEPVLAVTISPKENGLLVATPERIYHADFDPRYPEAGVAAFFRPVWYEGYAEPQSIWQSSSGTDDFEMKLGLMPLIFGTLKATFYSMLFGAPLALLAAIFTSEFLHGRARNVLKPGIELMASLPSVVLGFLAALVFAPFVEKVVPSALALFVALPFTLLLGAYCWQLLPGQVAIRNERRRFYVMALLIPVGVMLAFVLGPPIENLLFGGDIKGWLSWSEGKPGGEQFANPVGGWMLLMTPISAFAVALGFGRFLGPWMRQRGAEWDRHQYAVRDMAKFGFGLLATVLLAFSASWLFAAFGFDPRGTYVDTYVQRNAMIVGVVMGFAIIPIIYTIAEDALSTVPEHLRSASLGAGATTWQTATRIVIPTAMSGLFSALMVGLGRAVGETMIVLMAAGNTPVMEWNIFEGFRTLSANIAVELPEAVKGDTHYRTLFLAALVLFLMTFVVNTIAEVIRLRFRKRAYQL